MIRRYILLIYAIAGSLSWVTGQVNPDPETQLNLLKDHYRTALNYKSGFVNGSLYQDAYPGANGHPFLGNGSWSEGSISTKERTIEGLQLRYDLVRDLLIYNHIHEAGIFAVGLNGDKIGEFTLQGHRFIHFRSIKNGSQQEDKSQILESGFFEEITRGKVSLYVKWIKKYDPPTSTGRGRFILEKHIYILKEDSHLRISGKRGLLRTLQDQEKPVRKYIREHRITLHGNDPSGYKQVVDYYNSIQP